MVPTLEPLYGVLTVSPVGHPDLLQKVITDAGAVFKVLHKLATMMARSAATRCRIKGLCTRNCVDDSALRLQSSSYSGSTVQIKGNHIGVCRWTSAMHFRSRG